MAVHKVLGQYKKFINGSTRLSETTFNDLQRLIQIDANDKFECSDVRIVDANSDDACNSGCFPIQQHATHFPFNTDDIQFDSNDGLLFVLIPYGRSFGIQIAYDPINEQFWMRKGIRKYVSYSATTGVTYEFVPDTDWECLNPKDDIVTGEELKTQRFYNGKPIYRRCFSGNCDGSAEQTIASNLGNVEDAIDIRGTLVRIADNLTQNIGMYTNGNINRVFYHGGSKLISLQKSGLFLNGYKYNIIFEYTKKEEV